jgi:transcriptional regulator with XRE-family HTH domain
VTRAAFAIHRPESALRRWLRGQLEPNATDLRLLAAATGASVEWLLFGRDERVRASVTAGLLARVIYRLECEGSRRSAVGWNELSAAKRRPFEERARAEILEWLKDQARAFTPKEVSEVFEWVP